MSLKQPKLTLAHPFIAITMTSSYDSAMSDCHSTVLLKQNYVHVIFYRINITTCNIAVFPEQISNVRVKFVLLQL